MNVFAASLSSWSTLQMILITQFITVSAHIQSGVASSETPYFSKTSNCFHYTRIWLIHVYLQSVYFISSINLSSVIVHQLKVNLYYDAQKKKQQDGNY
jgi:hypothetical protein